MFVFLMSAPNQCAWITLENIRKLYRMNQLAKMEKFEFGLSLEVILDQLFLMGDFLIINDALFKYASEQVKMTIQQNIQ